VDKPGKIGPETLFPCASLSKPVSTTLLAHAGVPQKLGSAHEDPWAVSVGYSLVDEFDRTKALNTSLRQWLSHRSGLPDHAGDLIEDLNPSLPQDALITCLLKQQTGIDRSHPFNYTNFGFTLGCIGDEEGRRRTHLGGRQRTVAPRVGHDTIDLQVQAG
jgi:CubicO group peptidase (beta-lactamase class C family)